MEGRPGAYRDERGATIIEVLVATLLLALGVAGIASSLRAGTVATATADVRLTAARLAESELEVMRSLVVDEVGIDPAAEGYLARFEGRRTVTEAVNRVTPRTEVRHGGITFTVERAVTWATADTPSGPDPAAYKQVTVVVRWDDRTGSHEVRRDGAIVGSDA